MASILLRNPGMAKLTPHKEDCEVLAQVTQLIHHLAQRAFSVAESVGHDALEPLGFNDDGAVGVVQKNGFSVLDIFSPVTTAFLEFSSLERPYLQLARFESACFCQGVQLILNESEDLGIREIASALNAYALLRNAMAGAGQNVCSPTLQL